MNPQSKVCTECRREKLMGHFRVAPSGFSYAICKPCSVRLAERRDRPRRLTVVVAETWQHVNLWCHQNNVDARTVIHIGGASDLHRIRGVREADVVYYPTCENLENIDIIKQEIARNLIGPSENLSSPPPVTEWERASAILRLTYWRQELA